MSSPEGMGGDDGSNHGPLPPHTWQSDPESRGGQGPASPANMPSAPAATPQSLRYTEHNTPDCSRVTQRTRTELHSPPHGSGFLRYPASARGEGRSGRTSHSNTRQSPPQLDTLPRSAKIYTATPNPAYCANRFSRPLPGHIP